MRPPNKKNFTRINHQIRVPEVRLVDPKGEMLGVKSLQEALRIADDAGLDLVEIAPQAQPPVCKITDYSKYLYQKEKKSKEAKKNKGSKLKEVRFRIKIGEHDFQTKTNHIVDFLKDRHKVRVSIVMFGREMQHKDLARTMVQKIAERIQEVGTMEANPQMYGNRLITILVPGATKG